MQLPLSTDRYLTIIPGFSFVSGVILLLMTVFPSKIVGCMLFPPRNPQSSMAFVSMSILVMFPFVVMLGDAMFFVCWAITGLIIFIVGLVMLTEMFGAHV